MKEGTKLHIDKAIKILNHKVSQNVFQVDPDALTALKLSIDALQRVKESRTKAYLTTHSLLPGETKD